MKLIVNFLMLFFAAACLSVLFDESIVFFVPLLVAFTFIPQPKGVARMAVTREIWTQDIIDNLFKNNDFALRAYNADQWVVAGKVVHIPVAGSPSAVKKNLAVFPQTAVKRTDADILYALDTYYTVPVHIEAIEQFELAYDKRQSVIGEDQKALIEACMDGLLFRWCPGAANVVLTTGAATAATATGATGNRKLFGKDVFGKIRLKMNKANLKGRRTALLTSDHCQQLIDSFSDVEKTNFNNLVDAKNGVIGRYLGIDVIERSTAARYRKVTGVWTAIDEQDEAFGESDQTADSAASIFYEETSVERAKGSVLMYDKTNDPTYYGDVYSFNMRLGGRIRRTAGVYAVVEDASA